MNDTDPNLHDLVTMALDKRQTSVRQLAAQAQGHGFAITGTTLGHIRARTYKSVPSDETVRALAWLAGVPKDVAFAAAGRRAPGPPLADELPPGVDNLSPKSRRAVIELLRVLVEAEERDGSGSAAPMKPAGGDPAGTQQDQKTPTASAAPEVGEQEGPSVGAVGGQDGLDGDEQLSAEFFYGLAADDRPTGGMAQRDAIDAAGEESQAGPDDAE